MFSEKDRQKGLRISVLEGSFATVHVTLTTGAFLTGFALLLGANDFQIALLMSLPLLTQVLQIFSVHAIERFGYRKWISGIFSVFGRSLWAFPAIIPLIPKLKVHAISIFLICFVFISMSLSFAGAPWLSWMADLVPAQIRGRYFGMRNMVTGIVTMMTSIGAGQLLDHYKMKDSLNLGYSIVLIIAVLCGIMAFYFLTKQPEPPYQRMPSYHFFNYLSKPFHSTSFRKLLYFYLFFTFALSLASSYFPVYLLKTLNWSFSSLALMTIGSSIITLLTQPLWGRIVDRFGHKPVIKTTVIGLLPLPVLYIIATPTHSWPIWLDIFFTGMFWSGFNLVMFNMVIYSLPQQGRPAFLAVYSAMTGLTNFIGMIIGGFLAQHLSLIQLNILGHPFINYHFLFLLTLMLRAAAIPLINRLAEPEAKTVGVMIRRIFLTINRHVSLGHAFWFLGRNNRKTEIACPECETQN
jgi:MFS family permease